MATTQGNSALRDRVAGAGSALAKTVPSVKELLDNVNYKARFQELLGKNAAGFMSSIVTVSSASHLKDADPYSVIGAAAVAAALNLPIDPNIGHAHIVPYKVKQGDIYVNKAQFQLGYKGFVQLAMRTSLYKTINVSEVYEGEIKSHNRITGDMEFDFDAKKSDKVIGYVAYFRLTNGFEKYLYWPVERIKAHGERYSKSYKRENGRWALDFDAMARKTVLKMLLSKFGVLSIEMQTGLKADQAMVTDKPDGEFTFDYGGENDLGETITVEAETVADAPAEKTAPKDDPAPKPAEDGILQPQETGGESLLEKHKRMTKRL
jgi:recombination protein RecT